MRVVVLLFLLASAVVGELYGSGARAGLSDGRGMGCLAGVNGVPGSVMRLRGGVPSRKKRAAMRREAEVTKAGDDDLIMEDDTTVEQRKKPKKDAAAAAVDKKLKKEKKEKKERIREEENKKVKPPFRPWIDKPKRGETLVPSLEAYDCLFPMTCEWPPPSFDVMEHKKGDKKSFPAALKIVVGTQASQGETNKVTAVEIFGLRRFRKRKEEVEEEEEDDDDDSKSSSTGGVHVVGGDSQADDTSSDEFEQAVKGVKVEPKALDYSLPHNGTVNRLRCMPQSPHIVATLSEYGDVHIFDMADAVGAHAVRSHPGMGDEGFALGWSLVVSGRLASGDSKGRIVVHEGAHLPSAGGDSSRGRLLRGHKGGVECLAWSPTEGGVLVSGGQDGTLRVWDLSKAPSLPGHDDEGEEEGDECVITVKDAHEGDVNAVAWNELEPHLVATGGEEGSIKIWDLRSLRSDPASPPIANFQFHRQGVLHISWHPTDPTLLIASSKDDTVSVWDASVERDESTKQVEEQFGLEDLPPQLLFLHQGQREVTEAMWHPLLPSLAISAGAEGFHIWKASTL